MRLFTFERGEVLAVGKPAVYHVNLDCVAYLQEITQEEEDKNRPYLSPWFVSAYPGGWFVTKDAFKRIKLAMESK